MSTLLALLQDVDPTFPASMAVDLRAGLVAINQQAEADPACIAWSLSRWWQWLDDEGYEREAFLEALRCLGAASISDAALADLGAACMTRADDSRGLALFQGLLEESDADLIARLHQLEAMALAEENQLAQAAGGMSKSGAKWVVGGVLVGASIAAGIDYAISRHKIGKLAKSLEASRLEKAAVNNLESDLRSEVRDVKRMLTIEEVAAKQDSRVFKYDSHVIGTWMLDDIAKDPQSGLLKLQAAGQDIFENAKDLSKYSAKDIERRALILTANHIADCVAKDFDKAAVGFLVSEGRFKGEVARSAIQRVARKHPDYKAEMERRPGWEDRLVSAEDKAKFLKDSKLIRSTEKRVQEEPWFRYQRVDLAVKLRNAEAESVYNAYHYLVNKEVEAATKVVKSELENSLSDQVAEEAASLVHYSEVMVNEEIIQVAEAARAAERDAQQIVVEDAEAAGGLL